MHLIDARELDHQLLVDRYLAFCTSRHHLRSIYVTVPWLLGLLGGPGPSWRAEAAH